MMKKLFIILSLAVFTGNFAIAQSSKTDETIYAQVDVQPEFTGGIKEMYGYIGKSLRYPKQAVEANITGKVFAKMVIEKDGSVQDVTILKGIGFGCDEEVQRILKAMPKWTAGKIGGKNVRTSFTMPIMFALENGKKGK